MDGCSADQSFSSLVQWGQRVASMAISLLQKGQTLVVGAASGSSFFFRFLALLTALAGFRPSRHRRRC